MSSDKKTRVFVSGAITGVENPAEHFKAAEEYLLSKDYAVINPYIAGTGMLPNAAFDHGEYMRVTLTMLDLCDCIYMLDGWENSVGANAEYEYAVQNRKGVLFESEEKCR